MTNEEYLSKIWSNEDQMTADTYTWINHNYPEFRKLIFHVPNGGYRNKIEGAKMKSMGVVAGVPDLLCVSPLFAIELKMPSGTLSPEQKVIHGIWKGAGVPLYTCYSAQQVMQAIHNIKITEV